MQDYAMAKYSQSFEETIAVSNAAKVQLAAPSVLRCGIIISSPAAGVNLISLRTSSGSTIGIRHNALSNPLIFTLKDNGKMVQLPFEIINTVGVESIVVVQTLLSIPIEKIMEEWFKLSKENSNPEYYLRAPQI